MVNFMGSAPPARLQFLGYNEYQWAYIQSLGYALDSFSDCVGVIADIKNKNESIGFAHASSDLYRKILEIGSYYVVSDTKDENVTALDAAHKKATSPGNSDEILAAARRAESAAQSAFMMSCINI